MCQHIHAYVSIPSSSLELTCRCLWHVSTLPSPCVDSVLPMCRHRQNDILTFVLCVYTILADRVFQCFWISNLFHFNTKTPTMKNTIVQVHVMVFKSNVGHNKLERDLNIIQYSRLNSGLTTTYSKNTPKLFSHLLSSKSDLDSSRSNLRLTDLFDTSAPLLLQ